MLPASQNPYLINDLTRNSVPYLRPGGRFSKAPETFRARKAIANLEPCEYRAVLVAYSKDEERFPSYKKLQAYTLLRF